MSSLVAILAAPPSRSSGQRSRARVELARRMLECETSVICNLLDKPTEDVRDLAAFKDESIWVASRTHILKALDAATHVVLAYGISRPVGPARAHFLGQEEWLRTELRARALPIYTCGPGPAHPSRWQRVTSRHFPDLPFAEALALALQKVA